MALQLDKPMVDTSWGDDDGWGDAFGGDEKVLPAVAVGMSTAAGDSATTSRGATQPPELPVNSQGARQSGPQLRSWAEGKEVLLEKADHLRKGMVTRGAESIQDLTGFTDKDLDIELQTAATLPCASILTTAGEVAQQQHSLHLATMEGDIAMLLPQTRPPPWRQRPLPLFPKRQRCKTTQEEASSARKHSRETGLPTFLVALLPRNVQASYLYTEIQATVDNKTIATWALSLQEALAEKFEAHCLQQAANVTKRLHLWCVVDRRRRPQPTSCT